MVSDEKSAIVLVQTLRDIDLTRAKVQSLLTSEDDSLDSTLQAQITSGGFPMCPDTVRLLGPDMIE